jgi:hypothetical protein
MKLFIALLVVLIFYIGDSLCVTISDRIVSKELIEFQDSITNFNERLMLIEEILSDSKTSSLELPYQVSQQNNQYLGKVIDSFGVIYTIISILITIIALVIPVLMYLFGIRPAQKAVKELRQGIDEKIDIYIKNHEINLIDKSIKNLESDSPIVLRNAINYLTLYQNDGFTDAQLFKLYMLLKNEKIDDLEIEDKLVSILTWKRSQFLDEYFKDVLFKDKFNYKDYAYTYYINVGISQYYDTILEYLMHIKVPDKKLYKSLGGELYGLLGSVILLSSADFKAILNNKEIIDLMSDDELVSLRKSIGNLPPFKFGLFSDPNAPKRRSRKAKIENYQTFIEDTYFMQKPLTTKPKESS